MHHITSPEISLSSEVAWAQRCKTAGELPPALFVVTTKISRTTTHHRTFVDMPHTKNLQHANTARARYGPRKDTLALIANA